MNTYEVPGAGGSWEHRGGDCLEHGSNVPFAKPYGSSEKLQCVKCMLECSAEIAKREAQRAARAAQPVHARQEFKSKTVLSPFDGRYVPSAD